MPRPITTGLVASIPKIRSPSSLPSAVSADSLSRCSDRSAASYDGGLHEPHAPAVGRVRTGRRAGASGALESDDEDNALVRSEMGYFDSAKPGGGELNPHTYSTLNSARSKAGRRRDAGREEADTTGDPRVKARSTVKNPVEDDAHEDHGVGAEGYVAPLRSARLNPAVVRDEEREEDYEAAHTARSYVVGPQSGRAGPLSGRAHGEPLGGAQGASGARGVAKGKGGKKGKRPGFANYRSELGASASQRR